MAALAALGIGHGRMRLEPTAVAAAGPRWALIGDSITALHSDLLAQQFSAAGVASPVVSAWVGSMTDRRVTGPHSYVPSGIDGVASVRRAGEPLWWVIELGNNDSMDLQQCHCADPVREAGTRIDRLRAALGADARVIWVTVHDDVYPGGASAFDAALAARASPTFVLVDWRGLGATHPEWFIDGRHPGTPGVAALGQAIGAAVAAAPSARRPLCPPSAPAVRATSVGPVVALASALRCTG
jgi:hypothetical protein